MMKTLVLIRHGHRDIDADERDNGLSERGQAQARDVRRFFEARFAEGGVPSPVTVLSSPKRRCRETLAPLAGAAGCDVLVDPKLDEAARAETTSAFDERIQRFLRDWVGSPARLTIACSHNDWIPRAMMRLVGHGADLPNGAWFEVDWHGRGAELTWFLPSPALVPTRS